MCVSQVYSKINCTEIEIIDQYNFGFKYSSVDYCWSIERTLFRGFVAQNRYRT